MTGDLAGKRDRLGICVVSSVWESNGGGLTTLNAAHNVHQPMRRGKSG